MKFYEALFGAVSIVSFIIGFKLEDPVYRMAAILAGFIILIVVYLGSKMNEMSSKLKEIESSNKDIGLEVKRIEEKVKIYEKLAEHDVRLKNLEFKRRI